MLQHLSLWLLILKARQILKHNATYFLLHMCDLIHVAVICLIGLVSSHTDLQQWYTHQLWNVQTATTRKVTVFLPVFTLLSRDSHSSNPDWVTGVKGHWVRTTDNTQELQFPLWDQQVGFLSRSCNFWAKRSVTYLLCKCIFIYCHVYFILLHMMMFFSIWLLFWNVGVIFQVFQVCHRFWYFWI